MAMAPAPKPSIAVSALRSSLIDNLIRFFLGIGAFSVCLTSLRNILAGGSAWSQWPAAVSIILILGTSFFRASVPEKIRSSIIVAAFVLTGTKAIMTYGVPAPGAFLIPTGIILSWLLLGARAAVITTGAAFALVITASGTVFLHGAEISIPPSELFAHPLSWLNLMVIQIFVGGVLVMSIRGLVGILISERSKALEATDRLEGILEGIRDAFVVVDTTTGIVERANPAAELMFGRAPGTMTGLPLGRHIDTDGVWTDSAFITHASSPRTTPFRWRCIRKGGNAFWTEVAARTLDESTPGRLLATFRDIESTVQEEEELESLNLGLEEQVAKRTRDLERSRRELEYIAFAISDDLRYPLERIRSISNKLSGSLGSRLPAEGRQFLSRVENGAQRMDVLIEALLGLSSIDHHAHTTELVDMTRLARECCEEVEILGQGTCTERPVAWDVSPLPTCRTDAGLVRQVWANLISNAFKFSAGTPDARVRIRHVERPDGIWYEVSDNGIGFEMSHADKLFRIFQRLNVDGPDGLGIGLATTKRIVDRLAGVIEAEGRPGLGATFRFRLGGWA